MVLYKVRILNSLTRVQETASLLTVLTCSTMVLRSLKAGVISFTIIFVDV